MLLAAIMSAATIIEEDPKAIKNREPKAFIDESLVKEVIDSGLTKTLYGK